MDLKQHEMNKLTILDEKGLKYDDYTVQMLMENKMKAFLDCKIKMTDGRLAFSYNIENLQSAAYLFSEKTMRKQDMMQLILQIKNAINTVKEYMLLPAGILLEPEYIFYNGKEYLFCYLPGLDRSFSESIQKLAQFILQRLDYSEKEGVILGYNIYRKSQEPQATIDSILIEQSEKTENTAQAVWEQFSPQTENVSEVKQKKSRKKGVLLIALGILFGGCGLWNLNKKGILRGKSSSILIIPAKEQTTYVTENMVLLFFILLIVIVGMILIGRKGMKLWNNNQIKQKMKTENIDAEISMPTVCLADQLEAGLEHRLVEYETQKEMVLAKDEIVIGKDPEKVDYTISKPEISRVHAKMFLEVNQWYIQDLQSTNGTFLNGEKLESNKAYEITQGDDIHFADKHYIFL